MNKDLGSTLAGGGAGLALLTTVNWAAVPAPYGEGLKILVAFGLIVAGFVMYREPPPTPPAA